MARGCVGQLSFPVRNRPTGAREARTLRLLNPIRHRLQCGLTDTVVITGLAMAFRARRIKSDEEQVAIEGTGSRSIFEIMRRTNLDDLTSDKLSFPS